MSWDTLKIINSHPRDKNIKCNFTNHVYTVNGKKGYTSITTICKKLFKPFDSDKIINLMMKGKDWESSKYFGMSKNDIKNSWKKKGQESSSLGTKLHEDIEKFYNNRLDLIQNNSKEYSQFLSFQNIFNLIPYRTEWMIYDEKLLFSGCIDFVSIDKNGKFSIYDWKRCESITKINKYGDCCIYPELSYIPDSNYWIYSFQLNLYKFILEKNYDIKIEDIYLVKFHPLSKSFERIRVADLQNEIKILINLLKKDK